MKSSVIGVGKLKKVWEACLDRTTPVKYFFWFISVKLHELKKETGFPFGIETFLVLYNVSTDTILLIICQKTDDI